MNILLIGPYFQGSTTKMRGEALQQILNPTSFKVIDVETPQKKLSRVFTSLGWRFKVGPMIKEINKFIKKEIYNEPVFDIVWIEKAVFIELETMLLIKDKAKILIHFTPDPAFLYHKSKHFNKTLPFFDFVITTKTFELELYKKYGAKKILLTTQGFDKSMHKSSHKFAEKKGVVFIGHYETNRAEIIQFLIDNGITVKLVGVKWKHFAFKNRNNPNLVYIGTGVYGKDYSYLLSSAKYSLGLLSKWIPELHTTRTFEITACKTALFSESNSEIDSIYVKNIDYLPFENAKDILDKIKYYEKKPNELEQIIENGFQKVYTSGLDHFSIVKNILEKLNIHRLK